MTGKSEGLTEKDLDNQKLKESITGLLSGIDRSSGSSDWLKDMFLAGDFDAMVNYECLIIDANEQLVEQGREPLYVIYPYDGLSFVDSPLGYVDHGDQKKQEAFLKVQEYLLSDEVQKEIEKTGRRTDIVEGGHILSIGTPEAILELNNRLEPNKERGKFLPFEKLMDLFDEYPVIVGAAHPYREGGHVPELSDRQLRRLHFLDLNGKDVAQNRELFEERTKALADELGIPMISGSDTHQAVQYGCICTELKTTVKTVKDLYKEMKKGDYKIVVSSNASFMVKTAGI